MGQRISGRACAVAAIRLILADFGRETRPLAPNSRDSGETIAIIKNKGGLLGAKGRCTALAMPCRVICLKRRSVTQGATETLRPCLEGRTPLTSCRNGSPSVVTAIAILRRSPISEGASANAGTVAIGLMQAVGQGRSSSAVAVQVVPNRTV